MKVELKPFIGTGVRSKRPVAFDQWHVLVDGQPSGYLGFAKGCRVLLYRRFSPIDQKEIERQAAELTEQQTVGSSQSPEVPEEYREQLRQNEEGINADDFDT